MADSPGVLTWLQQLVLAVNNIGNQFKAAVTGPGTSVNGDLASFGGTTGTVLADSGVTVSSVLGIGSLTDRTKGSSLVGYLGTGTGATGRTVESKLDDFVSVKDFGAKGDGVTDDTAAIQAAVNSGAAIVFFPNGTYILSGTVTITKSLTMLGGGQDILANGASVTQIRRNLAAGTNTLLAINSHNVSVQGINFTGVGGTPAANLKAIHIGSDSRAGGDANMANGSTTINSATANFTAADVAKAITVGSNADGSPVLSSSISSVTNSQTAVLANAAPQAFTNASWRIGTSWTGTQIRNCSTDLNHDIGIHFQTGPGFLLTGSTIRGKTIAVKIENQMNADSGDSWISDCLLATSTANAAGQYCLHYLSSGGLKITNCKFLNCYNHIFMDWESGGSGNFLVSNCSLENNANVSINMKGIATFKRVNITGNTFGSGTGALLVQQVGTIGWLTELVFSGNTCETGIANSNLVDLGYPQNCLIQGNTLNGNSVGGVTGVKIRAQANRITVNDNVYIGLAADISFDTGATNLFLPDAHARFTATIGAAQSFTSGAWTTVNLDTVSESSHATLDAVAHTITPTIPGLYEVSVGAGSTATGGTNLTVGAAIALNGTRVSITTIINPTTTTVVPAKSKLVRCNGTTDTLSAQIFNSGTTPSVDTSATDTHLEAIWVAP